jgi:hypothetical protein
VQIEVQKSLSNLWRLGFRVAISDLGIKASTQELTKAGWQSFTLLAVEPLCIAAFVLNSIIVGQ